MTQPVLGVVTHRLGLATLAATGVLILLGGLVTNTGAALAVPDWPSTFGHNMFLFPWSQMIGGVFYEHSHRLVGALVGLLTLVLAAALWREGGRLRRLGLVAVAVVLVQGVWEACVSSSSKTRWRSSMAASRRPSSHSWRRSPC
jgi:heme A synthase